MNMNPEDRTMHMDSLLHAPHDEYTYRLPTPPRIVVPPPTLTAELPNLEFRDITHPDLDSDLFTGLDLKNVIQQNTLLEWSYALRHQAQQVLPMIYLGPMLAAKDQYFIGSQGITMALAIRTGNTMNGALRAAREMGLQTGAIDFSGPHDIQGRFDTAISMINQHLNAMRRVLIPPGHGKVLVFCESGNEKSATVVAAYLMVMLKDCDHIRAMQICQAQRFCIGFDDTTKNVLQAYWDIVCARRATEEAALLDTPKSSHHGSDRSGNSDSSKSTPEKNKKRGFDEIWVDTEDVDMDGDSDISHNFNPGHRKLSPFHHRG